MFENSVSSWCSNNSVVARVEDTLRVHCVQQHVNLLHVLNKTAACVAVCETLESFSCVETISARRGC